MCLAGVAGLAGLACLAGLDCLAGLAGLAYDMPVALFVLVFFVLLLLGLDVALSFH